VNGPVVVDASLAVKWLVDEDYSDEARAIARSWEMRGVRTAAPHLMPVEVTNALHRRTVEQELSVDEAADLLEFLLSSGLELHEPPGLHRRALELASLLQQGAAYDSHYLALAETLNCELWTADERFHRAASQSGRNVRWIGEPGILG